MTKTIAIIGESGVGENDKRYIIAYEVGKRLMDEGYRIQSGGMGGVMEAAFKGARDSSNYVPGNLVAIVPSFDPDVANAYVDIIIPTGLDLFRNPIVVNADAVLAIGGGSGTLSEMAHAWALKRLVIGFDNVDGWSAKLAGMRIDESRSYGHDDQVFGVDTVDKMIDVLSEKLPLYAQRHQRIK